MKIDIGSLSDPKFIPSLEIAGMEGADLQGMLRKMLEIREVERAIAKLVTDGIAKTPCHLAIGQEAICVGVSESLTADDLVFGNHRSHGHYLALDGDLDALMAEVLGKENGCSGGRGGSMHLSDERVGFRGSVPIVAGTIPLAVGAGMAAKKNKRHQVAVSYFGDGAAEEGVLHESLNLARMLELPVVFVCENNLFSSHLDIFLRQPGNRVSRYAEAHDIENVSIDGNDLAEVTRHARSLIEYARTNSRPVFIEAITYRWLGHVGPAEDIDVGVQRRKSDIEQWKKKDPIGRYLQVLMDKGIVSDAEWERTSAAIKNKVNQAVKKALAAPYPKPNTLLDHVYHKDQLQ